MYIYGAFPSLSPSNGGPWVEKEGALGGKRRGLGWEKKEPWVGKEENLVIKENPIDK